MKSIMQDEEECYLCRLLYDSENKSQLEEHHCIHGTANRAKSELYGLKVYLCIYHHQIGTNAVHKDRNMDMILIKRAQMKFEEKYGHDKYMEVFKKNYL